MSKHYKLIVGHRFSLSNETDYDPMTDYFPGIWAISSQKRAMKYSKELLAEGNTISVTDYDNPEYHVLANKFIKELGLSQPLFPEPKGVEPSVVTNGKPQNLSQLKKYLTVGKKVHVQNYYGEEMTEKDTSVLGVQTQSIIFEKTLGSASKSWFDLGKASEWKFTNEGAEKYGFMYTGEKGNAKELRLVYKIIYQD